MDGLMDVTVSEMGERPVTLTKSRRFAPAGAKVLGEVLGQMQFGDRAEVVLDWSNSFGLMPAEVAKPLLLVSVTKRFPQFEDKNILTVYDKLDVDDLFGGDNMTAESIRDIVNALRDKMEFAFEQRKGIA